MNTAAMVKKIIRMTLIFAGALAVGICAAFLTEWMEERQAQSKEAAGARQEDRAEAQQNGETDTKTRQVEETKKVALTFDDGPNGLYTEPLLDGLKERGVVATFFVLGSEVERFPQLVRRASEEGHLIGVHSYKHVNLRQLSDKDAMEQVDRTNAAIYDATGHYASYIRPPFGDWKEDLDYASRMIEVLWDVDPNDWATDSADLIVRRVLEEVEENSIILLHDASESSVQAAFTIIDALREQGYEFVTVEEILLD